MASHADTPTPPLATSRTLVGLEHAMRITDDAAPFNVVMVLRLDGELPLATLRHAVDTLQRRHRLLRARILTEGNGYAFHFDSTQSIAIDVSARSGPDEWIAAAQDEFPKRFLLADGPLMRCRYLSDAQGGDLIVTLHHTIVDASSARHLLGELLDLCAGVTPEHVEAQASEGAVPAPALYPKLYKGFGYARALGAFMRRQMADEMKYRWNARGLRQAPIHETGRCCLLPVRFPEELTAKLIAASRQHRVTLNSILGAGMLSAVQRRLYPSPLVPLRHIIFADLRDRLHTPMAPTTLGCLLTMFRFTVNVPHAGDFWGIARDIQDSTALAARTGERYLAYSMSPGMMKMIFKLKAFRMGATALSYSGPIDLPETSGSFRVTGVHAFAANMTLGPEYTALVRLFRGELWWDIMYMDSDMNDATARDIAKDMQTILEAAC